MITLVEPVASEGDIIGTLDCVIGTDCGYDTIDPNIVTVAEDSTVDQSSAAERHVDELHLEVS